MPAISAAPTGWRPAFVGGSLGAGLNASLLRKLQILVYWLALIFPGVTITYVQGSPSGSSASGGTHAGPGDAVDLEIFVNGRAASVKVYIIASLIMRLLFCLAYVRGQDVNGDLVKDDSFDPHLHIIDREGVWLSKAPGARTQITQFVAHQNGLIGGHPDLEASVGSPIPLATYADDLFRARFMMLTSAAAVLAVHTEPPQEEEDDMDMFRLVEAAYEHHFGREASRDEVNTHVLGAVAAGSTPAELYLGLAKSPEARDPQIRHDRIAGYYVTYLGRPGAETAEEILGWANSGKALGEIRALIAGSAEATLYAQQQEA